MNQLSFKVTDTADAKVEYKDNMLSITMLKATATLVVEMKNGNTVLKSH